MSIKVTLEFANQAELVAFFTPGGTAGAEVKNQLVKAIPNAKTVAAATAPAPPAAPPASSPEASKQAEVTPEQLTKVIVSAVARTNRDTVLAVLKNDFGVGSGKEITDPATRAAAVLTIGAL